jgi:hypothetical protein
MDPQGPPRWKNGPRVRGKRPFSFEKGPSVQPERPSAIPRGRSVEPGGRSVEQGGRFVLHEGPLVSSGGRPEEENGRSGDRDGPFTKPEGRSRTFEGPFGPTRGPSEKPEGRFVSIGGPFWTPGGRRVLPGAPVTLLRLQFIQTKETIVMTTSTTKSIHRALASLQLPTKVSGLISYATNVVAKMTGMRTSRRPRRRSPPSRRR